MEGGKDIFAIYLNMPQYVYKNIHDPRMIPSWRKVCVGGPHGDILGTQIQCLEGKFNVIFGLGFGFEPS